MCMMPRRGISLCLPGRIMKLETRYVVLFSDSDDQFVDLEIL